MGYPSSIDSYIPVSGTSSLAGASTDHGNNHNVAGSAFVALEKALGTTNAQNVISAFTPNQVAVPMQNGTLGVVIAQGTFNNGVLGSPSITNGTASNITVETPNILSGTLSGTITNNGIINNGSYGTPAIDVISARNAGTGIGFNNAMYPSVGTITDSAGGTFTVDARASQIYYCVLGTAAGNRTLGTPSNPSPYQQLTFAFKTSGSANGTLVISSVFRSSQDYGTPTLGTGVSWNYYNFRFNAIDSKWDYIGQVLNLV